MAYSKTALKYGWLILTGITLGTTIFVVNNQRNQVKQEDIIEIVLGVTERCLATQYTTNDPPYYRVAPPSFVRNWDYQYWQYGGYKICYTSYWPNATPNVVCYTNFRTDAYVKPPNVSYAESWTATGGYVWVTRGGWPYSYPMEEKGETITNTIGWHTDRAMMVSLDATIKALVPYYVDTNSVYDGTTNIAMLTVTGLWDTLDIGDGTNKFTRTPAWTNQIGTNWIVSYTNLETQGSLSQTNAFAVYTTNGGVVTTNFYYQFGYSLEYTNKHVCYTTSQDMAVWVVTDIGSVYVRWLNYPESAGTETRWRERFVPTQGYFMSNFPQVVSQTTNAATYGDYPWQIYVEDLQERYKVLEALKMTYVPSYFQGRYKGGTYAGTGTWAYAKTKAEENFNDDPFEGDIGGNNFTIYSVGGKDIIGWEYLAQFQISSVTQMFLVAAGTYVPASLTTNIAHKTTYFGKFAASGIFDFFGYFSGLIETPDYYQIIAEEASWGFKENSIIENLLVPDWGDIPTWCDEPMVSGSYSNRGFNLWGYNYKTTFPVIDWQFNYATNKYW